MENKKVLKVLEGIILPKEYNSNGKIITFSLLTREGKEFLLQADNYLRKLRKKVYQNIVLLGENRIKTNKSYFLVKAVSTLGYEFTQSTSQLQTLDEAS